MEYRIFQPHFALKKYVKYFWTINVKDQLFKNYSINTFVDDSSGIIFQHQNGYGAIVSDGVLQPVSMIYGPITQPSFSRALSDFSAFGVLFHPYAINSLFRTDSSLFADNIIDFTEFDNSSLTEQVIETSDPLKKIDLITNYLLKKLACAKPEDQLIHHCLTLIKENPGRHSVRDLCRYFSISEKSLERKFSKSVGVNPRHYVKIVRFNKALELIREGKMTKLSDIAYYLNYYDQSHFINDVKRFTGYNPKKINGLETPAVNLLFEKIV